MAARANTRPRVHACAIWGLPRACLSCAKQHQITQTLSVCSLLGLTNVKLRICRYAYEEEARTAEKEMFLEAALTAAETLAKMYVSIPGACS